MLQQLTLDPVIFQPDPAICYQVVYKEIQPASEKESFSRDSDSVALLGDERLGMGGAVHVMQGLSSA